MKLGSGEVEKSRRSEMWIISAKMGWIAKRITTILTIRTIQTMMKDLI